MHVDEVENNVALVKTLLVEQFPQWATLPIKRLPDAGTVNVIYRLGDNMSVRLPRTAAGERQVLMEQKLLPKLAPLLPLTIPTPLGIGRSTPSYPFHWSIHRWLPGDDATTDLIANSASTAVDLANFISTFWQITVTKNAPPGRGLYLTERDRDCRAAIAALHDTIDTDLALTIWDEALRLPRWEKSPVWIHGDLLPTNLLVQDGKLNAVIDFGTVGVGDPACDLIAAWSCFSAEIRPIFRNALAVDDATWLRGRAWAFSQALIILPYYRNGTNPFLVAIAERVVKELFAEYELNG